MLYTITYWTDGAGAAGYDEWTVPDLPSGQTAVHRDLAVILGFVAQLLDDPSVVKVTIDRVNSKGETV